MLYIYLMHQCVVSVCVSVCVFVCERAGAGVCYCVHVRVTFRVNSVHTCMCLCVGVCECTCVFSSRFCVSGLNSARDALPDVNPELREIINPGKSCGKAILAFTL